jgi:hypothetical protein
MSRFARLGPDQACATGALWPVAWIAIREGFSRKAQLRIHILIGIEDVLRRRVDLR